MSATWFVGRESRLRIKLRQSGELSQDGGEFQ